MAVKAPSVGVLAFGILCLVALDFVAIGPPGPRPVRPVPVAAEAPPGVNAGGFTISSVSVDLPIDDGVYPDGPNADVINANCTSCHSASMALTQPPLAAEQWTAIVEKMRDTYKAPVPKADVPAIIAYLTAMSGKLAPKPVKGGAEPEPSQDGDKDVTG